MNKIIINVDDFGLTSGVNLAVFELHKLGIVNSTTALVNSPCFEQGIIEAKQYPDLGVGIHLTIDLFKAEIYDSSLCDQNQNFFTAKTHDLRRPLDPETVYREFKAQLEKFIKLSGVKPTHIDSHHHVHVYNDSARLATERLGLEYNLPVREFTTEIYKATYSDKFYGQQVSNNLAEQVILELLKDSSNYKEVMVHPAIVDDCLHAISSYNSGREREYQILSSQQMQIFLKTNNIMISSYRDQN